MKSTVFVSVPATSGNLGPGFDVLGMALFMRNELAVRVLSKNGGAPRIVVMGEGAGRLAQDRNNLVYRAFQEVFRRAGRRTPRVHMVCRNRIPVARGLGSSAAARVAGMAAANRLLHDRFSLDLLAFWASRAEGHPDNVLPALFGGVRASLMTREGVLSRPWPAPRTAIAVAVPDFHLPTKTARAVLPARVLMRDVVANLSSVALLPTAFERETGLLKTLLNDRLHEPHRARLVPGFHRVRQAALTAGAHGVTLSGAGPTMLAFVPHRRAVAVAAAMKQAFARAGVESRALVLTVDKRGVVYL